MSIASSQFQLTAGLDVIDTQINAEGSSVFVCLRTRHKGTEPYSYIQVQLTAEQAEDLIGTLQEAVEQARTYGFVEWVQQTDPALWARWIAGPHAGREGT